MILNTIPIIVLAVNQRKIHNIMAMIKRVSVTPSQWREHVFHKCKPGDLIWISEEQDFMPIHENQNDTHIFETEATLGIIQAIDPNDTPRWCIVRTRVHDDIGSYGIHIEDIVRSVTHDFNCNYSAQKIQRCFRKYISRKKKIIKALAVLQPIAREWYVNPNNPNHIKRMREIAKKWGMKP